MRSVPHVSMRARQGIWLHLGYMPAMFAYTLYGYLLDTNSGITGYNYVFSVMIAFSLMGFICSTILVKRIKSKS